MGFEVLDPSILSDVAVVYPYSLTLCEPDNKQLKMFALHQKGWEEERKNLETYLI